MAFNRAGFTAAAKAMGYNDNEINQIATLREEQEKQRIANPSIDDQLKELELKKSQLSYNKALAEQPTKTSPVSTYLQPTPTVGQPSAYITKPKIDPTQFLVDQPDVPIKKDQTKSTEKNIIQKGGDLLYGAAKFLAPKTVSQFEKAAGAQEYAKKVMADKSLNEQQKAQKLQDYVKDIQSGQLKSGLELSSYLVPAGKGVTGMAKMGAVMGGMRGASEGKGALPDITSTLKGAAGGAAAGAIIGVGSKAVKGLVKNVPERIMNSLFKEPIKATKAAVAKGETLGEEALKRGEIGGSESIFTKAISKVKQLEDQIQQKLMGTDKVVDISKVKQAVKPLVDEYTQAGNTGAANSILERISSIESQSGSMIPAARANEIKRTLYDEARRAYGSQASESMEGIKAIARGFKEQIGSIPGIKQINQDLAYFGRVADAMTDQMVREGRNNALSLTDAVLATGGIPGIAAVAGRKILGSTQGKTAIAQGINKVGQGLEKIAPAVLPPIVKGAQLIGSKIPGALGQPLPTPSVEQTIQNVPNAQQNEANTSEVQHTQSIAQTQNRLNQLSQAYNKALEAGDDKAAERIKKMYDMEKEASPISKKMSSTAAKDLSRNQTAIKAVQQLEKELQSGGGMKVILSALPGSLGARQYRSLWGSIIDTIGTNRTGAAYTTEQRKDYAHLLPVPGDDDATIKFKMQNIKDEIQNYVNNLSNTSPNELPPIQ